MFGVRTICTLCVAAALAIGARAQAEDSGPRRIETRPLKLIGDGSVPASPRAPYSATITTPPLRLVGNGAAVAPREAPRTAATVIETRPLKLIGAKQ